MGHAKSNYGPFGPTITFAVDVISEQPVVRWLGVDENLTADMLVQPAQSQGPGRPAEASNAVRTFLEKYIRGSEMSSRELFSKAEAYSIAQVTLRRVAREMGVVMRRDGVKSLWSLPKAKAKG